MPLKTISVGDFIAAINEAFSDALEIMELPVNYNLSVLNEFPVQVLFQSFEGTPIDFPVTGVGVKTDDNGQVIALVISCTHEGQFNAVAQAS